jgi:hypothetical protein
MDMAGSSWKDSRKVLVGRKDLNLQPLSPETRKFGQAVDFQIL